MTFAFQQDVPITLDIYREILGKLGDTPPPGLMVHLAIEHENGLRYIDVWESREAHARFVDERLHPAVHPVLEGLGLKDAPEPETIELEVADIWGQTLTGGCHAQAVR